MAKLSVPGAKAPDLQASPAGTGDFLNASVDEAYRIDVSRSAAGERQQTQDLKENQVVELHLEGDVRRWVSADRLGELVGGASRGDDGDLIVLPAGLPSDDESRGISDWALKALRIVTVKGVANKTASTLAKQLEAKLIPTPGLHRVGPQISDLRKVAKNARLKGDDPWLLFIHGTASKTAAAFAGLGDGPQEAIWRRISKTYGDRILALEHKTLTESPIESAVLALEALPKNARVHVVSHSRGGLVGELLCRGHRTDADSPFTADELAVLRGESDRFKGGIGEEQIEHIKRLSSFLKSREIHVEKFVRVAATASGTKLAGDRLDDWASILVNLLGYAVKATGNPVVSQVYEFATAFLLAMVKTRGEWDALPGLAAQMPESALVGVLNIPGVAVTGDLSVIAGDTQAAGVRRRLAVWAADLFFEESNDFVVQTSSMTGGADRGESGLEFRYAGPAIHHCNYFGIPKTAGALEAALLDDPEAAGFVPIARPVPELGEAAIRSRNAGEARPVVFVLPGIMGSHLEVDGNRIWLDLRDIAFGRMKRLHVDHDNVVASDVLGRSYDKITEFLQRSHEVRRFPFDWRISLLDEADRFAETLGRRVAASNLPVSVLAHSMGGLLARTTFARHPGLWDDLTGNGGRLVMLGTPNGGSHAISRVLTGQEGVLKKLVILDLFNGPIGLLRIISRFPGILQMLPRQDGLDLLSADTWQELKDVADPDGRWVPPTDEDLQHAKDFRALLDAAAVDSTNMLYVAGHAPATPVRITTGVGGLGFESTTQGDGRVPWDTGIPEGLSKVWYMDAVHGELANHEPAFPAVEELLTKGETSLLDTSAPVARGPEEFSPLPADVVPVYPSIEDLEAAALGFDAMARPSVVSPDVVEVSVAHGDLAFARHPVFVGHYDGDVIVSAERVLDVRLERALTTRHERKLYPGPVGTAEVVFNRTERHPHGAVVIGLGHVGGLSAGALQTTFLNGILRLVTELRARDRELGRELTSDIGISPLLIGTGEGGVELTVAIRAVLLAVRQANERFSLDTSEATPRVRHVEFVELFEDRALQAAVELVNVCHEQGLKGFKPPSGLRRVRGGRRRAYAEEEKGWWWRVQVEGGLGADARTVVNESPLAQAAAGPNEPSESDAQETCADTPALAPLRFTLPTGRARAGVATLAADRRSVDMLLETATRTPFADDQLSQVLFELLVPNEVKDHVPEGRDLLLLLDEDAARYPWELLRDPMADDGRAIALRACMVRQLMTGEGRTPTTQPPLRRALVIGDPQNTHLPKLDHAAVEAGKVSKQLEAWDPGDGSPSFRVNQIVRGTHGDILRALFSRQGREPLGYQVLHVAAHGEYNPHGAGSTGIVTGNCMYLLPETIDQLPYVPDLVFLNCCHLGAVESGGHAPEHSNRIAANLGTQLIRMGVKAVVAAGWAVNDQAASIFANAFYREMLDGNQFGYAVLQARQETHARKGSYNTWGAYQCYGDPSFRLVKASRGWVGGPRDHLDPLLAVVEVDNLRSRIGTVAIRGRGAEKGRESLNSDLSKIERNIPERWRDLSDVAEALGKAHGALGNFETATEYLRAAAKTDRPTAAIGSQEAYANLKARHAAAVWYRAKRVDNVKGAALVAVRKQAVSDIDDAIEHLQSLVTLYGVTSERLCLLGSAYKRLALVGTRAQQASHGNRALEYYASARALVVEATGQEDLYPLVNWLALWALRYLRGEMKPNTRHTFEAGLDVADDIVTTEAEDHPFFGATAREEVDLLRKLVHGGLADAAEDVTTGYVEAFERGGTIKELFSVRDQMRFLHEMLRDGKKNEPRKKLREAAARGVESVLQGIEQRLLDEGA